MAKTNKSADSVKGFKKGRASLNQKSPKKKQAAPPPTRNGSLVANFLEILLLKYDLLVEGLHLPRIDRELYEELCVAKLRHFISNSEENRKHAQKDLRRDPRLGPLIGGLELILVALKEHREACLDVMRMVEHREDVLQRIMACVKFYDEGRCTLDDAQISFLLLLQELQMATVLVVDALKEWEGFISTPQPFLLHNGVVYVERIEEDCRILDNCSLGRYLALHLGTYPCCSQVDLPRLTHRKDIMRRSKMISSGAVLERGLDPAFCKEILDYFVEEDECAAMKGEEVAKAPSAESRACGSPTRWKRQEGKKEASPSVAQQMKTRQERFRQAELYILEYSESMLQAMEYQLQLGTDSGVFMPLLSTPMLFIESSLARGCVPLDKGLWPEMLNSKVGATFARDGETLEMLPDEGEDLLSQCDTVPDEVPSFSYGTESSLPVSPKAAASSLGSERRRDEDKAASSIATSSKVRSATSNGSKKVGSSRTSAIPSSAYDDDFEED